MARYKFKLRGVTVQRETLAELSEAYSAMRDASREGASTFPTPKVWEQSVNGPFGRFSYNGRIWHDAPWQDGDKPLFDNMRLTA